jgi:hypothetical protein
VRELYISTETPKSWVGKSALCAQTDQAFFPEKGGSTRKPEVCLTCDVRNSASMHSRDEGSASGAASERRQAEAAGGLNATDGQWGKTALPVAVSLLWAILLTAHSSLGLGAVTVTALLVSHNGSTLAPAVLEGSVREPAGRIWQSTPVAATPASGCDRPPGCGVGGRRPRRTSFPDAVAWASNTCPHHAHPARRGTR